MDMSQNGRYPINSQAKGIQNSRNNAARLPKPEKQKARTSYFEVGIKKNTPLMATVTSQVGPLK